MRTKRLSEDQLCGLFADKLVASQDFNEWLLNRTKFKPDSATARLLHKEQEGGRMRWWRHWWCEVPGVGQSETDIMAVYERPDKSRFCLHVENKLENSKWSSKDQAASYRARAEFMAGQSRFMNYDEFATVLLAPISFMQAWGSEVRKFDTTITHEGIAPFIHEFAPA